MSHEPDVRLGQYTISTDRARLDLNAIHDYIANTSYWGQGRPFDTLRRAVQNSALVAGAYEAGSAENTGGAQVGFARLVTDLATFAWLCDVYVLPEHQGNGLGKALVGALADHPLIADLPRQLLATADAHSLYAGFGFTPMQNPSRWMQRGKTDPDAPAPEANR